ncbi:MAG TPA: hypothetical protein VM122_08395 [Usitatibacter sp.]|nr:hypothetical protein [Usitatibacter sp.]
MRRKEEVGRDGASFAKILMRAFGALHAVLALLFAVAALLLIGIAAHGGWLAIMEGFSEAAALGIIDALGLAAVAVVALQIAQTIAEEEVIREAHVSAPTRVRRFLSRFLVVLVVALTVEGLIGTFKALHEDPSQLPYMAALLAAVGFLLLSWGVFIWCNRGAEELEPEAMEEAKREDRKLK